MTVETTDYTPGGKPLSKCTPRELLLTIEAIETHGMLRMHAQDRLMNRVSDEVESRKMGLYCYRDDDSDPENKGLDWSIGERKAQLNTDDHHYAVSGHDVDWKHRVWVVNGPYTKVRDKVRAFCDRPTSRGPSLEEQMKAGGGSCRLGKNGPMIGFC